MPQTSSSRLWYMLRQNPTYGRSGPGCASTRRDYALSREGMCDGARGHPFRLHLHYDWPNPLGVRVRLPPIRSQSMHPRPQGTV